MIEQLNLDVGDAILAIAILISIVTDVKDGKILNLVTLPLIAVGVLHGAVNGAIGQAIVGFGLATVIHFPLWMLGIERGGDTKLLMGIGAFMGISGILEVTGWFALLYIPVGLLYLLAAGRLGGLRDVFAYQWKSIQGKEPDERPEPTIMRTAPVIGAAWALARFTTWFDIGVQG